jgi:hypothetical protein
MGASQGTRGHAKVGKIIEDIEQLLPSELVDQSDYRRCRTTYGLLSTTYKRTLDSKDPTNEYKQLSSLERGLRTRLANLDPDKGLPRKIQGPLDSLTTGIDDVLKQGVTIDFITQGLKHVLDETPDATPAPKPEPAKTVPEARYKKVREELAAEKEKNKKLNEESNGLVLASKKQREELVFEKEKNKKLDEKNDRRVLECKKVREELAAVKDKHKKLNEENNRLVLELKKYQMRSKTTGKPPAQKTTLRVNKVLIDQGRPLR